MMDYGYGHAGHHWGALVVGLVVLLAAIGVLVWVVATLLHQRRPPAALPPPAPGGPADTGARRILDERFARGEIDADEYTSRRNLLDGGE